jgi:hypothetical protein
MDEDALDSLEEDIEVMKDFLDQVKEYEETL